LFKHFSYHALFFFLSVSGGFSETYAALCDYNGISCKEEVQWDVDTIYHSQDNREFNLVDFSHLESRDLAVIVASLAYNTWFTKLYCKDIRIGLEVTEQVLHTLSKSSSLEEITLENAGLKSDFPQKLSVALSENPASVIHSLNLAHNTLDNQGVANLIQQVCRLSKGLRLLNLSKTFLNSKGVVSLSQTLCSSDEYSNSLLHLDLSKNPGFLSGEDASNLCLFLSQPNCLVHLDLSGTDCSVDLLFGALLRGCCADLSYLNLSKNTFSHRKVKENLPLFRQFFSSAFSLTHVSLASMKLPPEALRSLFIGLTTNPHINDLHLDISGCELKSAGASVIQELFPRLSSIATLDISDNGLDADLLSVLPALSKHTSLKHLYLGKNFNIKSRVLDEILHKLVQLIQEEECVRRVLVVTNFFHLRMMEATVFLGTFNAADIFLLAFPRSVPVTSDLVGWLWLCLTLVIPCPDRSVTWDRNNTSATGFLDVARALEHNFTLQYMPLPLSDISQAYRSTSERTEQALTKIQRALLRNNQTQRFSQRQALRLHQGLVTSTAEQVMERLSVCVQQQVCVLRGVGEMEEIQAAKQVLKEARNSRALYPSLCELAHVLSVDGPVRQRLDQLAGELTRAADKELQVIVDSMVSLCRELCPLSSSAAERLSPQLSSVSERVSIPRSAIRTALMERAAQDIHRALEEVKLSVVSYLTNSIVDQILQELYATHKTLTRRVSQVKRWEVTCDGGTGLRSHRHRDSLDLTDDEMGTSIDTIAIKKRSSRTRRIRPVSTRLSQCDDSSFSPPPSVSSSFSSFSALSRSTSWEGLSELPTQGAPLHHVTRVRPRPPRRHRAGHAPSDTFVSHNICFLSLPVLFFLFPSPHLSLPSPPLFPYISQLSSLHKAHSLRRKKRRNMLAIFGFRRNRNSTLSNQGPDSGRDGCGEECRTVAMAPTGTATENVYTLLQPPLSAARAGSPGEGGDVEDQRLEEPVGLSLQPVQSIPPQPGMPGSRHPFYSLSQQSELETEHEQPADIDRQVDRQWTEDRWVDRQWTEGNHTVRERTLIRPADRQAEQHWPEDKLSDKTWTEGRTADRQNMDRYWTESRHADRHMERQWTVDRQFDQDRQWTVSRQQTDRTWAEGRPKDIQIDRQWIDSRQSGRQTDRQDQGRHLAQRPLPPYPSPSPKSETDSQKNMDRQKYSDTQTDRHLRSDTAVGQVEGWRNGGGVPPGRVSTSASKPDPPSQSSKPNLSKLRQRHLQESSEEEAGGERDGGRMERKERDRDAEGQPPPIPEKPKASSYVSSPNEYANERPIPPPAPSAFRKPLLGLAYRAVSQGEETVRPQAPVKPQRNRKAMSCDTGTDRDSPNNLEKPSNRKPPVKKPRLPQNRNKSLDYPGICLSLCMCVCE
ncbi:unnamed protein product, partial [Oncorhynchus mykiss]